MLTVGDTLDKIESATMYDLVHCTIQVYYGDPKFPKPTGTAVLINFSNHYFIVSAAHVFESLHEQYHVPLTDGSILYLSMQEIKRTPLRNNDRNQDTRDIAALEVSCDVAKSLTDVGYYFLTMSDFKLNHRDRGERYGVVGFIANKTKLSNGIAKAEVWQYLTSYDPKFSYERYGFNREENLAIVFDGEIVSDKHPGPRKAPNLEGISGCGVWTIGGVVGKDNFPFILFDIKKNRKLVGIVTQKINKHDAKVLVATRINYVIYFIMHNFKISIWKKAPFL